MRQEDLVTARQLVLREFQNSNRPYLTITGHTRQSNIFRGTFFKVAIVSHNQTSNHSLRLLSQPLEDVPVRTGGTKGHLPCIQRNIHVGDLCPRVLKWVMR